MSPHQTDTARSRKRHFFLIASLTLLVVACHAGLASSTPQTPQDSATASAQEERKLNNTVPDRVPIKLKLKNEASFKDVKNKDWAREFELEVKNTGDQPIYFLLIDITLPDVTIAGIPYGLQLHYGRTDLFRLTAQIKPDDVPIRPGETVVIRIPADQVLGYEYCRDHECAADAKELLLEFQLINFGNGTGLRGGDGRPFQLS